jgi:hypothetical protein
VHTRGAAPEPLSGDARARFALCDGAHAVPPPRTGFLFRIALADGELGIVDVDGVQVPEAVPAYLNLALAIAPVCAAVIANARAHDATRQAQQALERTNSELLRANHDLAAARADLRRLQEILPICGWCKKVLDQEGAWTKLATYLAGYTGAEFTHGICRECEGDFFEEKS